MRRIDLLCKLLGPLAIASIAVASTTIAVWTTLGMNLASILPEYICIAQVSHSLLHDHHHSAPPMRHVDPRKVYDNVPALHRSSQAPDDQNNGPEAPATSDTRDTTVWLKTAAYRILPLKSLPYYFRHPAFLPSFSLCLLYLTVLSLSGQMITYLLSIGFTSLHVGIIRFGSTIFELSATWIAPWLMQRIGVVRSAIWSLSWQMIWLAAGASWFFSDMYGHGTNSLLAATGLVVGVAFSRVGLWSYDLCAQSIIQQVVSQFRGL